ncbi:CsbD family protein [Nitrospira sp. BLG_2]|uniref:CsbD family protein n=1 Tax=Nitrospira sp. BLG_2 TaxID=3397507 RepID=UPI003B98F463
MNAEQFQGKWSQFKGEVKRQWGKLTDDDMTEAEGNYDKFLGRVQERYGDKKEDVMKWTNEWFDKQNTAQSGPQR